MVRSSVNTRHVMIVMLLLAVASDGLPAQSDRSRTDAARNTPVHTSGVWLLVRPRVGDTLRLVMEQTIEVTNRPGAPTARPNSPVLDGTRTPPPRSPAPDYGPRKNLAAMRITRLLLYAHSLVEASDLSVTTLLATTDSMAMWAGTAGDARNPQMMTLPMEGRQVRVRVTPDGAMRVNDPPPGAMELGATLAAMPGVLPQELLRVGDMWERDIVLPSLPVSGYRADGVVHTRFRFDSLTRNGRDAWISLQGTMRRDGSSRDLPAGTRVITAGTMRGHLLVDRHRAWIVDARTVMDVRSEVSSGTGGGSMDLRILQRVRVR